MVLARAVDIRSGLRERGRLAVTLPPPPPPFDFAAWAASELLSLDAATRADVAAITAYGFNWRIEYARMCFARAWTGRVAKQVRDICEALRKPVDDDIPF